MWMEVGAGRIGGGEEHHEESSSQHSSRSSSRLVARASLAAATWEGRSHMGRHAAHELSLITEDFA
jgi:hypothetical protein